MTKVKRVCAYVCAKHRAGKRTKLSENLLLLPTIMRINLSNYTFQCCWSIPAEKCPPWNMNASKQNAYLKLSINIMYLFVCLWSVSHCCTV
uniref:Uncharacterized protein n=2 Tax=gambiae species complex TaxID=44542 RepID=A0A182IG18_ANOAR